jgi:hypothetical protein
MICLKNASSFSCPHEVVTLCSVAGIEKPGISSAVIGVASKADAHEVIGDDEVHQMSHAAETSALG